MRRNEAGHYLRTPLTVVKGVLQLLLRKWDQIDEDERRRQIQRALHHIDKVEAVIGYCEDKIFHNRNLTVVIDEPRAIRPRTEQREVYQDLQ